MRTEFKTLAATALAVAFSLPAFSQTETADTLSYPSYDMLDEIVVEAERPILKSDGAKTTYNVEDDPAANSSTALDILKKVPMVSVDGEGNVRLNGETNFKFQVNGQENPMLQQYADRILEAMPASAISKIEVITEPGAKEDAEGVAGIINIITERTKSQDGFSGNASLKVSNRNLGPSLYGIMKKDKVTLSANIDYQWGYYPQKSEGETTTQYLTADNSGSLYSHNSQKTKFHYIGGDINLSWEPNVKNLFTVTANIFSVNGGIDNLTTDNRRYDASGKELWSFSQAGDGAMKIFNISANTSYRHNFSDRTNYLILSYLLNFGRNNINIDQWQTDASNYFSDGLFNFRNSRSYNRGHTAQIDYANDFNSEHSLLEVGAKGIFRYNSAVSLYRVGDSEETLKPLPSVNDDIDQPQEIYAGYASYTGKFGIFTAVAGLRYEHTRMGIRYRQDKTLNFTNHLNDWVPNAAVTLALGQSSNLRAAYQMRISRPSIEQVNPFELALSPFDVRKGNPDLQSEKSHKVSLTYTNFGRTLGGNIGLEYTLVNNAISSYAYMMRQNDANVLVTSYDNIGRTDNIALTGFMSWSIIRNMTLTVNGRLAYERLKAPAEGYSNRGWTGNIGGAWNYTAAHVYKFSAYGGFFGRRLNLQGHTSNFYYYGLSVGRDFLQDKSLNVSISATNFAQKSMTFKNYVKTKEFISNTLWRNLTSWNVALSITWKFGTLNAQVKKTGVELDNDDISKSSNQSQGSSL